MNLLFLLTMRILFFSLSTLVVLFIFTSVSTLRTTQPHSFLADTLTQPFLVVLGTCQDAGSPHIGCKRTCCKDLWAHPDHTRMVVSLGLVDPVHQKNWLFEATPNLPRQVQLLRNYSSFAKTDVPDGIFVSHAHIGHYAGLMYLGREALNAHHATVFVMPRMQNFLTTNGPWSQLVSLQNIQLQPMQNHTAVQVSPTLTVTPIQVPHRDEYSETIGFLIEGPSHKVLFIPDIDKWSKWNQDIASWIRKVDYTFLDATFYDAAEINNRDIAEIPHPFVVESMKAFASLSAIDKKKVHFIHFNHTNPLLNPDSPQAQTVLKNGFQIARLGQMISL